MLYYIHFTLNGVPATGLSPTWNALVTADNATDKSGSAPAIAELAGGWYKFDIVFDVTPWDVATEDLVGVVDGGATLAGAERYKPVAITKRGLGLIQLAHKGKQVKGTKLLTFYGVDDTTPELNMTYVETTTIITVTPALGT